MKAQILATKHWNKEARKHVSTKANKQEVNNIVQKNITEGQKDWKEVSIEKVCKKEIITSVKQETCNQRRKTERKQLRGS